MKVFILFCPGAFATRLNVYEYFSNFLLTIYGIFDITFAKFNHKFLIRLNNFLWPGNFSAFELCAVVIK